MKKKTKNLRVYVAMWWPTSTSDFQEGRIEGVYATRDDAHKYVERTGYHPSRYSILEFPLRSYHQELIQKPVKHLTEEKTHAVVWIDESCCLHEADS